MSDGELNFPFLSRDFWDCVRENFPLISTRDGVGEGDETNRKKNFLVCQFYFLFPIFIRKFLTEFVDYPKRGIGYGAQIVLAQEP